MTDARFRCRSWVIGLLFATGCTADPAAFGGADAAIQTPDATADGASDGQPDTAADAQADAAPPLGCNGAWQLCERRLPEIALACTHNAMSNQAEGWLSPNQHHGLTRQLEDGVRAFMLDVHAYDGDDPALAGQTTLCHGPCLLGAEKLADGLQKFTDFLTAHPREVIVFVLEDHVDEAAIDAALGTSGLRDLCHHQPAGAPWPTLAGMIAVNRRVFVMSESGGGQQPWNHGYQAYAWDTDYANKTAADFSCERLRGKADNPLFVLNHFLTNPLASPKLAEQVNHNPLLRDRAQQCQQESGRLPNLIAVDFYDIGDVLAVARELNGLPAQ